jgi:formiminoglutamase/agmatinase
MSSRLSEPEDWTKLVSRKTSSFSKIHFGHLVESTTIDRAGEFDIVIIGEPYDRGHTGSRRQPRWEEGTIGGHPGAREGPAALRKALANTKTYNLDTGPVKLTVGDLGDIMVSSGVSNEAAHKEIRDTAQSIHSLNAVPIFLGGDHSLAFPNAVPLLDMYDSVGVINFDSHDDLLNKRDGQPHTASPFRQLYDAGIDMYTIFGARVFGIGAPSIEVLEDNDGLAISAREVAKDFSGSVERALDSMSDVEAIYVTIDVDVLDMAFAPGTSSPYPGGLLPRELFDAVFEVSMDDRVVGLEIVECLPMIDAGQRTAVTGGRTVAHAISGIQRR